jgi:hypothetical protein
MLLRLDVEDTEPRRSEDTRFCEVAAVVLALALDSW